MEPQYVQAARDHLARCTATLVEKKMHLLGAADRTNAADAEVVQAMSRNLAAPDAPETAEALETARAALAAARDDEADATRWALAAEQNVQDAEASLAKALRQAASERFVAHADELLTIATRVDELCLELGDLLDRGRLLENLWAKDAKAIEPLKDVHKNPTVWRGLLPGAEKHISAYQHTADSMSSILDKLVLPKGTKLPPALAKILGGLYE
ncbi:MAG TPA: hypothetical protein VGN75_03915 [Kaistia sp.]|jgi:uncharacterized membrane protein YqiK|nr:hypothetical protein [Kaistia sp.]